MQTNLYTDDSFKFNQVLKEMTMTVQDPGMGSYKAEHDVLKEQYRSGSSEYKLETEKQLSAFIAGMKRWTYLDTLQIIFSQFKGTDWARSSLQQLIKNTYILQHKFSEDEQDMLGDMLSDLKKVNSVAQKRSEVRSNLDQKIKGSLLEGVETAQDARATVIKTDTALQAWLASKVVYEKNNRMNLI